MSRIDDINATAQAKSMRAREFPPIRSDWDGLERFPHSPFSVPPASRQRNRVNPDVTAITLPPIRSRDRCPLFRHPARCRSCRNSNAFSKRTVVKSSIRTSTANCHWPGNGRRRSAKASAPAGPAVARQTGSPNDTEPISSNAQRLLRRLRRPGSG